MRSFFFFVAVFINASFAHADGLQALDQFVQSTKNGRAEFVQTVTAPSSGSGADMKAGKVKLSRGTFEFLRPNRFKFIYAKPFEQSIIADGQTLWLYDVDLNQVSSRKLASVMAGSPAALFASAPSLQALQTDYVLRATENKASGKDDMRDLQWVSATPKARDGKDSLLQTISVGLRQTAAGVEIAAIEMVDSFGQTSTIKFEKIQINTNLTPANFNFKVPAGVDVIRQ